MADKELVDILIQEFNDGFVPGEIGVGDEQGSISEAQSILKAMGYELLEECTQLCCDFNTAEARKGYVKWDREKVAEFMDDNSGSPISFKGLYLEKADQLKEILTKEWE